MEFDLSGVIDLHIHTQPDVQPRLLDDIQAARQAKEAGMKAILIKSHVSLTSDRATIAEHVVGGIKVYGGLTLNQAVGGLNPDAVNAAIQMGARVIWMPTRSARHIYQRAGKEGGLSIFHEDSSIMPAVHIILEQIKQADIMLASGHLSIEETVALVRLAKSKNLQKIVITHPEAAFIDMPVPVQQELSNPGVYFERCFVDTTTLMHQTTTVEAIGLHIRQVGVESTVLSTDLGQIGNPTPVEGMRAYLNSLMEFGFSKKEITLMASQNPAYLSGL